MLQKRSDFVKIATLPKNNDAHSHVIHSHVGVQRDVTQHVWHDVTRPMAPGLTSLGLCHDMRRVSLEAALRCVG